MSCLLPCGRQTHKRKAWVRNLIPAASFCMAPARKCFRFVDFACTSRLPMCRRQWYMRVFCRSNRCSKFWNLCAPASGLNYALSMIYKPPPLRQLKVIFFQEGAAVPPVSHIRLKIPLNFFKKISDLQIVNGLKFSNHFEYFRSETGGV